MIGLRPILSDSQPKKMKNGVASAIAMSMTVYASTKPTPGTLMNESA